MFNSSSIQRACVLLLIFSAVCLSADAICSQTTENPQITRARVLIEIGHYSAALRLLSNLKINDSDNTQTLFLIGLAATRLSQQVDISEQEKTFLLDTAIEAFREILHNRPELFRVRLELALAYFLRRDDRQSRQHFERVLAGNPEEAIALNIQRHLDAMWLRRTWRGYVGVRLSGNSNINLVSEDSTINLFGLPFQVQNEVESGAGLIVFAGGEYRYRLNKSSRLSFSTDLVAKDYAGRQFDEISLAAHVGPLWKFNPQWELSVHAGLIRNWVATNPYSRAHGIRLASSHVLSNRSKAQFQLAWYKRKISRSTLLTGPYMNASVTLEWIPKPTLKSSIQLTYAREMPKSQVWKNSSTQLAVHLSVLLRSAITFGAAVELKKTDYKGPWAQYTPGGVPREDRTRMLRLYLQKRNINFAGLVPQLSLFREVRESNAALYGYRRNMLEFALQREF